MPTLPAVLAAAREAFGAALDDDLNVSAGLAAVFDLVRDLNRRIERRSLSSADSVRALDLLRDLDQVLGILPEPDDDLEPEVAALLEAREDGPGPARLRRLGPPARRAGEPWRHGRGHA